MQSNENSVIDDLRSYVQQYTSEVHNHTARDRCQVMSNLYKERFVFNMIKVAVKQLEQSGTHNSQQAISIICREINQGLTPNLNMNGKQFTQKNMDDLASQIDDYLGNLYPYYYADADPLEKQAYLDNKIHEILFSVFFGQDIRFEDIGVVKHTLLYKCYYPNNYAYMVDAILEKKLREKKSMEEMDRDYRLFGCDTSEFNKKLLDDLENIISQRNANNSNWSDIIQAKLDNEGRNFFYHLLSFVNLPLYGDEQQKGIFDIVKLLPSETYDALYELHKTLMPQNEDELFLLNTYFAKHLLKIAAYEKDFNQNKINKLHLDKVLLVVAALILVWCLTQGLIINLGVSIGVGGIFAISGLACLAYKKCKSYLIEKAKKLFGLNKHYLYFERGSVIQTIDYREETREYLSLIQKIVALFISKEISQSFGREQENDQQNDINLNMNIQLSSANNICLENRRDYDREIRYESVY